MKRRLFLLEIVNRNGKESMPNRENMKALSAACSLLFYGFYGAVVVPAICLFCLISIVAGSCATRPVAIKPDDPLFGTWVNDQHNKTGSIWFAKKVFFPNGRELGFDYIADTEPSREYRISIEKAWIDAKGSHWYQIHHLGWQYINNELKVESFDLVRINTQGTILEQAIGRFDYPDELSPTDIDYVVYYKKK